MRSLLAAVSTGIALSVAAIVAMPSGIVFAHDPIIFTESQTTPESGPLLLDGSVSFALYGTLMSPGDTRGVRVRMKAGDTLTMSLLVPALEPEKSLDAGSLPTLTVTAPDGSVRTLPPGSPVTFDEPFTSTSYVRYIELTEPAQAGDYGVTVAGVVPARFTLSVGTKEQFGTAVENVPNRDPGVGGVMAWYSTPPPTVAVVATADTLVVTAAPTTVEVTTTVAAATTVPDTTAAPTTTVGASSSDSGAPLGLVVLVVAVLVGSVAGVLVFSRRRAPKPR